MEIIELLMGYKKTDINIACSTRLGEVSPLFYAVANENIQLIKLLLSTNMVDVNMLNKTSVDRILSKKVKSQSKSVESNRTALYLAVEKGNIDIIKLLLSNEKIDINIMNTFKIYSCKQKYKGRSMWFTWSFNNTEEKTAFYLAVEKEYIEIIKLLLSRDEIDINVLNKSEISTWNRKDNNEEHEAIEITAFYLAVEKENIEIINLIFQNKKLDLNVLNLASTDKSSSEKTVFYKAVEKENIDIIKLLLTNDNLDLNIINKSSYIIQSDKWISEILEKEEKDINKYQFQCNLKIIFEYNSKYYFFTIFEKKVK